MMRHSARCLFPEPVRVIVIRIGHRSEVYQGWEPY
jgi:hypothetical protein